MCLSYILVNELSEIREGFFSCATKFAITGKICNCFYLLQFYSNRIFCDVKVIAKHFLDHNHI